VVRGSLDELMAMLRVNKDFRWLRCTRTSKEHATLAETGKFYAEIATRIRVAILHVGHLPSL